MEPFPDRLARAVAERRSQLVVGLDPDPVALWPGALEASERSSQAEAGRGAGLAELAAAAVGRHCRAVIEAVGPACVAVKLQLACFERLGAPGWAALADTAALAREHGLLVIADGKRGDVPVTAEAYAQALAGETPTPFGPVQGLGADAFTVNSLLGADSLEPLVSTARERGAGCFCLVRTSNPGARDLQDLPAPAAPLHEALALLVDRLGVGWPGATGLSGLGAVTGATRPELLARLRELMPRAIFLLPGVGAQGGRIEDLGPAFAPHPAAALVTTSRSIVGAAGAGEDPATAAATAAEALRAAAWTVAGG
ncbi:MAG TPA: orotidine-5'-phosphate decarboxylase [Thermoleophilaceae bacterium]|nr:orotidine-5'-phosphate decarboxylase [Thermoleophilaceae bacterium]